MNLLSITWEFRKYIFYYFAELGHIYFNSIANKNLNLKLNLNWKPAKIPDLIKMLEKEVSLQESLTRGALYGTGNFELSTEAACLRVPQSVLAAKERL